MCISTLIAFGLIAAPIDAIPAPTLAQGFQVSVVDEFVAGEFESRYNVENVEICNGHSDSRVFAGTPGTLVVERVFAKIVDTEGTADCEVFQFFVDPTVADEGDTILAYVVYDSESIYVDEVFVIDGN